MTLETEKYDPLKTHWVRIVTMHACRSDEEMFSSEARTINRDAEARLEQTFIELNDQSLKQNKIIVGLIQHCTSVAWNGRPLLTYTIIAQVVDRSVVERQQIHQRLTRN